MKYKNTMGILCCTLFFCIALSGCIHEKKADKMEVWLQTADLWAEETAQELYEKALQEDVLQIYTVSGRIFDVAESFQKQYPGLIVEVTYLRAEELTAQLLENAESGKYGCDLLFLTNGDGSLTEKLIPAGLAYKYVPYDMADKISPQGNDAYLSVLLETALLTYNDHFYAAPPVTNWWELTLPEWKGRVYITDPSRSMISYTLFAMMEEHNEEMEQAYASCFGEECPGENAARFFIEKLLENDLQIVNDSDDIANAIAAPGTKTDAVGILNASKMRLRQQGYPLMVCYDLQPFAGVINPANIMIAGGSENVNGAKLFIRWIMGETDGTGEGYRPFLSEGAWSSRTDVRGEASRELTDISAIYTDEKYSCRHRQDFLDFWDGCLEASEK